MSNSERSGGDSRQQFSNPGWSMKVATDDGPSGSKAYHADVFHNDIFRCRIALGVEVADRAAAEAALGVRVQDWLNGNEARLGAKDSRDADDGAA
jgi:hypothetical protein